MPGTSPRESMRVVAGELSSFLHVVELPDRGPGADLIGRAMAMVSAVDSIWGVETTPDGWRICGARGRQVRRGLSYLDEDLDALEEVSAGYRGPIKCQIAGPWTLAAAVELVSGEGLLHDAGAVRDLAQALAEAAARHASEVRRRVPHASAVVVQLDEPSLPLVLQGRIGTASGLSRYAAVDPGIAERVLAEVMAGVQGADAALPGVHCCAAEVPVDLLRAAGARFVSMDLTAIGLNHREEADRQIGTLIEAGDGLIAGVVPSVGSVALSDARASGPLRNLLHRLGLEDDGRLSAIAVSPTCGLAGASPSWTREALASCSAVGRVLRQDEASEVRDGS